MDRIGVLLIDDHMILIDGVEELLERTEMYHVVAKAENGKSGLNHLESNTRDIDIIITDISLPDFKGPELVMVIKKKFPDKKIIALSMHEEKHIVKDMLKAGVDGYVLKKATHEELIGAIGNVLAGEAYVSPSVTRMLIDNVRNPSLVELLSDREKEIIALIADEYTSKKIAEKLFISEKTVEAHKTNIFRKTNTTTLVGLTKFAIHHQLTN